MALVLHFTNGGDASAYESAPACTADGASPLDCIATVPVTIVDRRSSYTGNSAIGHYDLDIQLPDGPPNWVELDGGNDDALYADGATPGTKGSAKVWDGQVTEVDVGRDSATTDRNPSSTSANELWGGLGSTVLGVAICIALVVRVRRSAQA